MSKGCGYLNVPSPIKLAALALLLVAAAAVGPSLHRTVGGMAWLGLIAVWSFVAWAAISITDRTRATIGLVIILLGAAVMRMPLLLEPPYLSSDVYRYIWDGRVQAAGVNPYRYVPAAAQLSHLRDQAVYPNINRAEYAPTIYPPAAQLFFFTVTRFGESVLIMKLGLLACEALAIAGIIAILHMLGMPTTRVVAYAWHPLPVWEIAGNGHIDAALLAILMIAMWLAVQRKVPWAGLVTSVGVLIKPTALLVMPVLWQPRDWKLPALLVAVVGALYVPYLSVGWGVFGFLSGYVAEEGLSGGGGFRYLGLLQLLTGPLRYGTTFYVLIAGAVIVLLALRVGFRKDRSLDAAVSSLGLLLTAFLVLLTPHYPWYYLVLVPFLALRNWITPWLLATGGFILYDVVPTDTMPPFAFREAGLHLTVLVAVAYDLWSNWLNATQSPSQSLIRS